MNRLNYHIKHPPFHHKLSLVFILFLLAIPVIRVEAQLIEQFDWDLKVGFVKFGDAHMIRYKDNSTGRVHIKAEAESTGVFKYLYESRFRFRAQMNPESGLPIQSSYNITQGDIDKFNRITYDHTSLPDSTFITSLRSGEKNVAKNSYELLTAFLHFQKHLIRPDMEEGERFTIKTYFTDAPWDLVIIYKGKEKINSMLGEKECYVFNPVPALGDFFDDEGDVRVWVTADEYKIPVKMHADLNIAGVTATLVDYQNPIYTVRSEKN